MGVRKEKRKNGVVYVIDYYVNGDRLREAIGPNKKEAEQVLTKRKAEVLEARHQLPKLNKVTFREATEHYLEWSKTNKRNWKDDVFMLTKLNHDLGNIPLYQVHTWHIEKVKHRLSIEGLSGARINRYLACLSGLFTKSTDWDLFDGQNPVRKVKRFKERASKRYLSKDEISKLLSFCSDWMKPAVLVALNTGMRRGEIFDLKWKHVDFEVGSIHIADSKSGKSRDIPMSKVLMQTMKRIRTSAKGDFVFSSPEGIRLKTKMKTAWDKTRERSSMTDIRFHDLRHTFGSHLAAKGTPFNVIKKVMGHSDIKTTLGYAHVLPGAERDAVNIMSDIIESAPEEELTQRVGHILVRFPDSDPKNGNGISLPVQGKSTNIKPT